MKSTTFCLAPYVHCLVHTDTTLKPCCASSSNSNYTFENYKDYWNSEELIQLRRDLHNGVKNKNCQHCWRAEESGKPSTRQSYNQLFSKFTNFAEVKNSFKNGFTVNQYPVTWDLRLGNLCNLKCVMCNPTFSDKIEKEVATNLSELQKIGGNYTISAPKNNHVDWTELDPAVGFIDDISKSAKWIKLQGGEPFAFKQTRKLLDQLDSDTVLSSVTNGMILDERLLECLSRFKRVELSISLEAVNSANDVIRYGSDWDKISKNLGLLKQLDNVDIQINHVLQATSIFYLADVIKYCEGNNLHLAIFPANDPDFLSIKSCPTHLLSRLVAQVNSLEIVHPKNQYIKKHLTTVVASTVYDRQLNKKLLEYAEYLDNIRVKKFKPLIKDLIDDDHGR